MSQSGCSALAKAVRICQREVRSVRRRRSNDHFVRPHAQGPAPFRPPGGAPGDQPALAIPPRLPEESGDGRIGHPVEQGPDRPDARRRSSGTRSSCSSNMALASAPSPARSSSGSAPDAKLMAIDTNADFIDFLKKDIDDPRLIAVTGSAADVEQIVAAHGFDHADYVAVGPALLDPAAGRRRRRSARRPRA